jgi:hypothetical protein
VTLSAFPPHASHPADIALALNALASAIDGRSALYVSAPITTGRRFVQWLETDGAKLRRGTPEYEAQHMRQVVEPNVQAVRPVIAAIRAGTRQVVIDPTAFADVPGWTQEDYRPFWAHVIERFADTVVFLDGWAYSEGSCYEWLVASRSGARTLDAQGRPLSRDAALEQMRRAAAELRALGADPQFIESVWSA